MHIVLIGTYELGRQPFGLASPASWLAAEGWDVRCLDLAIVQLDEQAVRQADLIAIHVPMHTATRLGAALLPRLKQLNTRAHFCAFGLYAPMNEDFLRGQGVHTILGGEFEANMVSLVRSLAQPGTVIEEQAEAVTSLERLAFRRPDRSDLPSLERYAQVQLPSGEMKVTGYTEASRGCKHLCRHCPIVPVYGGRFRVVPRDVVLADIEQQVAEGARHITFGDPDFLNAPGHAIPLLSEMHSRFPALTYDVTVKVEHLLNHSDKLQLLRDTGCLFVTSAVESTDDDILRRFDKAHTRADFIEVAARCRAVGLTLNPTFVTFTPWTTLQGYLDLLSLIDELGLVQNVSPIQYAIRLLIPSGSLLLDLPETTSCVGPYDPELLCYPWAHADPRVDALHQDILQVINDADAQQLSRPEVFLAVRGLARRSAGVSDVEGPGTRHPNSTVIPHLTEPWYCCAEPTDRQLAALTPAMKPQL